jgi:hypothetical protein
MIGSWRQDLLETEANLDYTGRSHHKNQRERERGERREGKEKERKQPNSFIMRNS